MAKLLISGLTARGSKICRRMLGWVTVGMLLFLVCSTNGLTYAEYDKPETAHLGKIIRIPKDKHSIQATIDSAGDGDIVLVSPGVYHGTITLDGVNITLASHFWETGDRKYINQTILDGIIQQNHARKKKADSVIQITKHTGPDLKILGFTSCAGPGRI